MNPKPRSTLVLMLLLFATTGCIPWIERLQSAEQGPTHPSATRNEGSPESISVDEGQRAVSSYLSFMDVLSRVDEYGWHQIFEYTLEAYEEIPSQERKLRLALVMSQADWEPGDPRLTRDLLRDSRDLLHEIESDPDPVAPLVRKFVRIRLAEIERRLALYEELESLTSQLAKAHQEYQTAQRDREQAEQRIRRIDAALAEANAKLEAVMDIEQGIKPLGKETFP